MYRLFSRQVDLIGGRDAVRDCHGALTYAELSARAGALAARIRRRCPERGARIGLHLGRTADLVAAVLAVSAAGHAYVPLDPDYPADRLRFMAADSALALVLSDREPPEALSGVPVLRVDHPDRSDQADQAAPVDGAGPDETAYVIYTSGSTGVPKGVEVRRGSVEAMVEAFRARYGFTERDVWTLFHSYCFDFSVWEMWGALATGATLVVVPAATAASPRATAELLVREGVTVLSVVPSVFRYLTAAVRQSRWRPDSVRRIVFGGEAVDVADIRSWRETVGGHCEFVNTYGITETTVFVSTRTLTDAELDSADGEPDRADREQPDGGRDFATDLGRPLDGWEVRVLDDDGLPVAAGGTGEIWVAGDGVAVGYLNRPGLTQERFRTLTGPDGTSRRFYRSGDLATRTADGVLRYAGRADDQVKINGFRIELGEVEAVLRRVAGVGDLAVVLGRSRIGGHVLTAHYTSHSGAPLPGLAEAARDSLPRHMVPGRFVHLAELPRNPSGKTDRRALAEHH